MSVLLGNGIPFLISLCLQIKHKEKNDLSIKFKSVEASKELINNNEFKQKKGQGKLFFLIILMALIYASTGIYYWFDNSDYVALNIRFFIILFVFLWSKVILKIQIFRHHYFSLLICFIGFILSSIPIFKVFTIRHREARTHGPRDVLSMRRTCEQRQYQLVRRLRRVPFLAQGACA